MHICWIVNVENLKLYEPSKLDQGNNEQVIPTIEDLPLEYIVKLAKDEILQKKSRITRQGKHELS